MLKIIKKLLKKTNDILIEEFKQGYSYRILVFNNQIIYAYQITKPSITGDSRHSVIQLINTLIHESDDTINMDQIDFDNIRKLGYEKHSVLPKGVTITITSVANGSLGAVLKDLQISDIHPDNIALFKKINRVTKLQLNGVDYLSPSIKVPYYLNDGIVLETNSTPGITHIRKMPYASDRFMQAIDFN